MTAPQILALDFDGVLLDGLEEYFQTAWKTYREIWSQPTRLPLEELARGFYRLRPVIESGWEMPLLIGALERGRTEAEILTDWSPILREIVTQESCDRHQLARQVDATRDNWIRTDLDGWLAIQGFYPGTLNRLQTLLASPVEVFIVSTKEGRFIHELLARADIEFPRDRIFGKEVKRPKYETLRAIHQTFGNTAQPSMWFVEDRLKALQLVERQPDLDTVELFLADWGYNIEADRDLARESDRLHLLSLDRFTAPLNSWIGDRPGE